tara:strand:+ start:258 stop:533 length:276 start_codon:yes stop_codon:yes gene_type:complete
MRNQMEGGRNIERYAYPKVALRESLEAMINLVRTGEEGSELHLEDADDLARYCISPDCNPVLRDLIFEKSPLTKQRAFETLLEDAFRKTQE